VADGAILGFAPGATNLTTRIVSAVVGSSTGGGLSAVFPGQIGNPSQPAGFVTSLTLVGSVPVSLQMANAIPGVIPLIGYGTLSGSGTVTTGVLPTGVVGVVTNDTAEKVIKLVVTSAPTPVYSTVVFNDTFEPDETGTPATRGDDAGDPADIIWRTRANTGSQSTAANFGVTNDVVLGNCLFYNGTGNFYVVGQFDDNPADGITTFPTNDTHSGGLSIPLGPNAGDRLRFTMDIRTSGINPTSSQTFRIGVSLDPDGPLAGAETASNTWLNDARGYYLQFAYGTATNVSLWKETGDVNTSPLTGTDTTQLTAGTGATVGIGADTLKHNLRIDVTRGSSAVTVSAYWDNVLVSTATDSTQPYDTFNTFALQVTSSGSLYLFDNVKLEAIAAGPIQIVPVISNVAVSNGNLLLHGTGGSDGGPYSVLSTTNLALPTANWSLFGTNVFDSSGNFSFTNAIAPGAPQQYFRLRAP
jgi:hypothetical protein